MFTERQNEIITVSINIIAKDGIQNFTIKNLSKEIGISEPAIYRHFKNKTEIIVKMLEQIKEFKINNLKEINLLTITGISKIEMFLERLLTKFSEEPALISIIFSDEIFKNDKFILQKLSEIMSEIETIFVKIISDAQKNNEINKDIESKYFVMIILGSLRLLVKKWELSNFSFNLKNEGKNLFNNIKILLHL